MRIFLLNIFLLCTLNLYSQNSLDTLQNLESIYIDDMTTYVNMPVKNVLDDFPYEVQGYNISSNYAPLLKDYGIKEVILFLEPKKEISIEEIFSGTIST